MRAIAPRKFNQLQVQFPLGLPIGAALAFCSSGCCCAGRLGRVREFGQVLSRREIAYNCVLTWLDSNLAGMRPAHLFRSLEAPQEKVKRKRYLATWNEACLVPEGMQGYITDRDFDLAERFFPGIRRFYNETCPRPVTFLELLWRYQEPTCRDIQTPVTGDSMRHRKVRMAR